MAAQRPNPGPRPNRRQAPRVEALDLRELLSVAGLGPHLGHFAAPGTNPQAFRALHGVQPALTVDAHRAINRELMSVMGPGLDRIAREVELQHDALARSSLSEKVLAQPFVHRVLSNYDTYLNFGQPWIAQVFAPQQLSTTSQDQTVTLTLPKSDVILLGDPSTIQVHPGDPAPGPAGTTFQEGFILQVPASELVFNSDNATISATVSLSQIPASAQSLTTQSQNNLTAIFGATGQLLTAALRTGLPQGAPTAVPTVPGLRLVDALQRNHPFPAVGQTRFLRMLRLTAANNLLNPNTTQTNLISQGLNSFLAVVDNWNGVSATQLNQLLATQTPGQLLPPLPHGPLTGTLALSLGVVQQPNAIQLNAPERIDVGYVFARNGDYGVILTARGPLSTSLPSTATNPVVAGDIQTQVSNAASLSQLGGWRVVEGVNEGSILSGGLASTNQNQVATFAASAGYGAGFEFGLGMQFTQVIPLGNVFTQSLTA